LHKKKKEGSATKQRLDFRKAAGHYTEKAGKKKMPGKGRKNYWENAVFSPRREKRARGTRYFIAKGGREDNLPGGKTPEKKRRAEKARSPSRRKKKKEGVGGKKKKGALARSRQEKEVEKQKENLLQTEDPKKKNTSYANRVRPLSWFRERKFHLGEKSTPYHRDPSPSSGGN